MAKEPLSIPAVEEDGNISHRSVGKWMSDNLISILIVATSIIGGAGAFWLNVQNQGRDIEAQSVLIETITSANKDALDEMREELDEFEEENEDFQDASKENIFVLDRDLAIAETQIEVLKEGYTDQKAVNTQILQILTNQ